MSVMVILVAFSIVVAAGFLVAFLWAVKSGQFDDKHTPAMRMLFDDKQPSKKNHKQTTNQADQTSNSENRPETVDESGSMIEEKREEENRYGS